MTACSGRAAAVVVAEQAAQPLAADYCALVGRLRPRLDQPAIQALVVALVVVVLGELSNPSVPQHSTPVGAVQAIGRHPVTTR